MISASRVRTTAVALALAAVAVPAPMDGGAHRAGAHVHAYARFDPAEVWAAENDPLQTLLGTPQGGPGIRYASEGRGTPARARGRLYDTGVMAAEPTLGITSDGTILFKGLDAVGTGSYQWPVVASRDGGRTWSDVSPMVGAEPAHPTGLDPILYVDEDTDRVFNNDFLYPCSELSFKDADAEEWEQSVICGLADHQNIFAGPPATSEMGDYPNVVYYCAIDGGAFADSSRATGCVKSLDGGLTWVRTGAPPYVSDPGISDPGSYGIPGLCDGTTGHGFVDREGVVYLPRGLCGQPWLAISRDEGLTWSRVQVADNGMPANEDGLQEHEAGVVVDERGTIYYFYMARDRLPVVVISRDGGETWGRPFRVGPPNLAEASLPAIDIGPRGGVAMAYIGSTDAPGGPQPDGEGPEYVDTTWNGYITVSTNLDAKRPVLTTVQVNAVDDPLHMHSCPILRCAQQYDFIDVVVAPDGVPWMAAVDACTANGACLFNGRGVVGRMVGGPAL
ncbi:MAG TPA: sialidase family protein [Actinomycetota bacterium]|nr:sialidase family protein [Actinomycetota bacterium]